MRGRNHREAGEPKVRPDVRNRLDGPDLREIRSPADALFPGNGSGKRVHLRPEVRFPVVDEAVPGKRAHGEGIQPRPVRNRQIRQCVPLLLRPCLSDNADGRKTGTDADLAQAGQGRGGNHAHPVLSRRGPHRVLHPDVEEGRNAHVGAKDDQRRTRRAGQAPRQEKTRHDDPREDQIHDEQEVEGDTGIGKRLEDLRPVGIEQVQGDVRELPEKHQKGELLQILPLPEPVKQQGDQEGRHGDSEEPVGQPPVKAKIDLASQKGSHVVGVGQERSHDHRRRCFPPAAIRRYGPGYEPSRKSVRNRIH